MPHPRHDLAVIDFRIWRPLRAQHAEQPALGARQCMVYERVVAGHSQLELRDHCAASGNRDGLNAIERRCLQAAQCIDLIEYAADDMEGRRVVWASHAKENADVVADLGMERMQLRQRADRAIEYEIFGALAK